MSFEPLIQSSELVGRVAQHIVNVRTSQPQTSAAKLLRKLAADGKAQALSSND